jgi:endonuclease/exonuclease/phosphatase family metal-dependent hydrolase
MPLRFLPRLAVAAATATAFLLVPAVAPLPGVTRAAQADTVDSVAQPLRVASYNVRCSNCGGPSWESRRDAVVETIQSRDLDVVGLQEASQAWLKDDGESIDLAQFEDLRNRLGGSWRLTDSSRNNCVRPTTPTRCRYQDQGASNGTRIAYQADRLTLLASGSKELPSGEGNQRYTAWAQFRQNSSGEEFMFASVHLEPTKDTGSSHRYHDLRAAEMEVTVATVKEHNPDGLPALIVGDFNSSRFAKPTNGPYDVLVDAGYVDPLGARARTTRVAPGAVVERRINTWLNSYNDFVRTPKGNRAWKSGSHIDYIFTTPMRVSEFEVVADLTNSGREFAGTIPSDHNMMRATVYLPR